MKPEANEIAAQLVAVLKAEGNAFLEDKALGKDVALLGKDLINTIFHNEVLTIIPIPELPQGASEELIADRAEIVEARARVNQLVAKAQLENTDAVQRVQQKALSVALRIGGAVAGVALGSLKGFLQ